jgi:NTE family protein
MRQMMAAATEGISMNAEPNKADLVLAGGGVKGIGHVGALSVLEDHGYEFQRTAGTSAGAIVGSLVAAQMPVHKIFEVLRGVDFRRFRDRGMLCKLPLVGRPLSALLQNGVYEGDAVREWMKAELEQAGVSTFADLKIRDRRSGLPPNESYKLVVMATDVTRGELVRLPWDYERYGLDRDKQLVADAVRASISIPYFFKPVTMPGAGKDQPRPIDGVRSHLVDGGVLSNFPIDAFDRTDGEPPRWPTFGVTLIPQLPRGNEKLLPILGALRGPARLLPSLGLFQSLVTTMVVGHDQGQLAKPWIAARSMRVDTDKFGVVDFELTQADQLELYRNGRETAEDFLSDWHDGGGWEGYLATHRRGSARKAAARA